MTAEEKENILVIQISVKQCVYILIRYMTVAGIKTAWKMYACTRLRADRILWTEQ